MWGFIIYSPISIFGFPVSILIVNPQVSSIKAVLLGFLITSITFLLYFLLLIFINRFELSRQVSILVFLTIPLLIGLARGLIFYKLVQVVDWIQPSSLANRLVSSTITTFFWLVLANYLVSVSMNFSYRYQSALTQYLERLKETGKAFQLSPRNTTELGKLQLNLSASVAQFMNKEDPESFKKMSIALVKQINDEIKPISKRIWVKNLNQFPIFRYSQLFKDSVRALNFSWPTLLTTMTALSMMGNFAIRGLAESFWRTVSFLIVLMAVHLFFEKVSKLYQSHKIGFNYLSLLFSGFLPVLLSEFFVDQIGYQGNWLATLMISPITPVLMIVLSVLRLAGKDRNAIIAVLERSSSNDVLRHSGTEHIENANIASYLHNSLQSELIALSKQLEEAAANPSKERSAELLQRVASTVNRSISEDFIKFNESPKDRLETVIQSWRGILDIKINFPIEILESTSKAIIIVQTIEEFATNVSRYGNADALEATAEKGNEGLILKLQSNGTGNIKKSKGFGTSWLNQVAISPWEIKRNKDGILLIIEI